MATKNPLCGIKAMYTDMLQITDLKNSIAASCAISGIFKEHQVGDCTYIDGGHWDNCPIFFDFKEPFLPVLAVNLGYPGLLEKTGGRISKIIRGLEISSYARVQEDIKRWEFEKSCGKRGELFVLNPPVWNVQSLNFDLKDWQIDELINAGYQSAKETFSKKVVVNV
jgi:predicted acylesterase/phospholipase RssA